MEDLFINDDTSDEIQEIFKKAENVLNDDVPGSISNYQHFRKITVKEVEEQIKQLENTYSREDTKCIRLLEICKGLLNIIKYDRAF